MMTRLGFFALSGLGIRVVKAQAPQVLPKTHLKVGDTAPEFTLPSTAGGTVSLSAFKGKKPVVLAFFPAAFTGG